MNIKETVQDPGILSVGGSKQMRRSQVNQDVLVMKSK
jgi:hypothetical protein